MLARGVLRRGGGELGLRVVATRVDVAVAAGAAGRRHVDHAVHVGGEVDGGGGVAGVAGRAVGVLGVRSGGRHAVAGAAGRWRRGRSRSGVGGVPAGEGAVAVDVGAGGAVPGGARAARRRERSEGEVDGSVGVGRRGRNDVALGAGDGRRRGRRPSGEVGGPRRRGRRAVSPLVPLGGAAASSGLQGSPGASRRRGRGCKLCWDLDPDPVDATAGRESAQADRQNDATYQDQRS